MVCVHFKTKPALVIFALFSVLVAGFMAPVTVANPVWIEKYPVEPVKTQPSIGFQSPQSSQTYASQTVWLNFTITKPASWFTVSGTDENGYDKHVNVVNITSVGYIIDETQNTSIPAWDIPGFYDPFPNMQLAYSVNLSLPQGEHSIKVWYKADSYYPESTYYNSENQTQVWPAGVRNYGNQLLVSPLEGASNQINFSIAPSDSFPTNAVISIAVVIVVLSILCGYLGIRFSCRSVKRVS